MIVGVLRSVVNKDRNSLDTHIYIYYVIGTVYDRTADFIDKNYQ